MSFVMNGGGASLLTGIQGEITLASNTSFTNWEITLNPTGICDIGLYKGTYANFPTVTNFGVTGIGVYVPGGNKGTDSTFAGSAGMTGAAGDKLQVRLNGVTGAQTASLALKYYKF
jgi:hypothetical protein